MIKNLFIFLVLNFGALAIGGFFTGSGVSSEWYSNLSKAPWTPPGWVFGAAWTIIMIAYSIYMASLLQTSLNKNSIIALFVLQWILNVAWNPLFFHYHSTGIALISISALTILIGFFMVKFYGQLNFKSFLIAPYFLWLLIATSLNAYILIKN
ncbi:MAG: TspO/MBR family protein [Salibacteraceae bacterium]